MQKTTSKNVSEQTQKALHSKNQQYFEYVDNWNKDTQKLNSAEATAEMYAKGACYCQDCEHGESKTTGEAYTSHVVYEKLYIVKNNGFGKLTYYDYHTKKQIESPAGVVVCTKCFSLCTVKHTSKKAHDKKVAEQDKAREKLWEYEANKKQ